jgi:hypothetical protein
MGLKKQGSNGPLEVGILTGDGAYQLSVVGESHYENNLDGIVGGKTKSGVNFRCIAALVPEPSNLYDPNAVKVSISGSTVGYLGRDVSPVFLTALEKSGFAAAVANAKIVGGWDDGSGDVGNFGVRLDAAVPFALTAKTFANKDSESQFRSDEALAPPLPSKAALSLTANEKKRKWPAIFGFIILAVIAWYVFGGNSKAEKIASILNSQFGRICEAKIEGFFSDTLKIDWTAATRKIDSITVMAAVGGSKSTMYDSGIRYLKIPNDAGGYSIFDWKTGEKTSVNERAKYYFQ